jgi:PAS domain S-box-containing protein
MNSIKKVYLFLIIFTALIISVCVVSFFLSESYFYVIISVIGGLYIVLVGILLLISFKLRDIISNDNEKQDQMSNIIEEKGEKLNEKDNQIKKLKNDTMTLRQRIFDISESYSTKIIENLKEANNRNLFIESVLDNISVNVYSLNKDGYIVSVNAELAKLLGMSKQDIIGEKYDYLSDIERDRIEKIYSQDLFEDIYHLEETININNNKIDVLKSIFVVRGEENEFIGAVVSFVDITRLKSLQRELKAINKENRDIMNNMKSGIISVGKNQRIKSQYSKFMEELFPDRQVSGVNLTEFLLYNNNSETVKGYLESFIDILLNRKRTPVSTINGMPITKEFPVIIYSESTGEYSQKFYKLNFERIYDNDEITGIMVLIDDITQQKVLKEKLEKEKQEHQKEIELIYNLLKINPQIGKESISEAYKNLAKLKSKVDSKNWEEGLENDKQYLNTLTRHSHSIKGLTKMLSMSDSSNSAHELENLFIEQRDNNSIPINRFIKKVNSKIEELEESLNKESALANRILGVEVEEIEDYESKVVGVEMEKIDTLLNNYNDLSLYITRSRTVPKKALLRLLDSIYRIKKGSVMPFVDTLNEMIKSISKSLGKKVHEIKLFGNTTEIDFKVVRTLKDPIIHLIRNILDHGIEYPEVRKQKGKNEYGNIYLSINEDETFLTISIKDDGSGIDMEKLRRKAKEMGISYEKENKLINLLFIDGFSTKEKVSEISGRGVGMSVVKEAVRNLGGKLYVKSVPDVGMTLTLKIPLTIISRQTVTT